MSSSANRYKAIIFDLDDTLLDWSGLQASYFEIERPHLANIHTYLLSKGHNLPPFDEFQAHYKTVIIDCWGEAKKTWAGVNYAAALKRLFGELGLAVGEIDMTAVLHAYDMQPYDGITLYDDTLPVLQSARRDGYKIGLITNSMMPMWMRDVELRAFEIIDYFDVRISSGDVGYMKPHPAIYQQGLAMLGVSAKEAIFVGDRPSNDIAGANNAGITSVLLLRPHLQRELNDSRPDHIIEGLSELLTILTKDE